MANFGIVDNIKNFSTKQRLGAGYRALKWLSQQ
jgi:hypothetical protein